jgi:hypothetical protein
MLNMNLTDRDFLNMLSGPRLDKVITDELPKLRVLLELDTRSSTRFGCDSDIVSLWHGHRRSLRYVFAQSYQQVGPSVENDQLDEISKFLSTGPLRTTTWNHIKMSEISAEVPKRTEQTASGFTINKRILRTCNRRSCNILSVP